MKRIIYKATLAVTLLSLAACRDSEFADSYPDPSKIGSSTTEKQFTGLLMSNQKYVVPDYWNYFVILRITLNRYTQAIGWVNEPDQYVPGAAAVSDRWNSYYGFVAQYREFDKIFNALSPEEQAERRIYKIAADIYFYDHSQTVVDLHGSIPWSKAGMLSTNNGDYMSSYAGYDDSRLIYTTFLDHLKSYADELGSIQVPAGIQVGFKTQDLINNGNVVLWQKYCNSLRLRMLTRVSGTSDFASRADAEIAEILGNPAKYPLVDANSDNIQIDVYSLNSEIHAKDFRTGLEDWNGNIAGTAIIDHLNVNQDPRLRILFEPGGKTNGVYIGLDQHLLKGPQEQLILDSTLAIYNRSTLSRNQFFPGILINAAQVSFYLAEYHLKKGNNALAKTAYENGIRQSVEMYYDIRRISNDNTAGAVSPYTGDELTAYLGMPGISFDAAATNGEKLSRIATQKWIHSNVVQPYENWAEVRRLNLPVLRFPADNSNSQAQPPIRWTYPASEITYNSANYAAVAGNDKLTTPVFWDAQ